MKIFRWSCSPLEKCYQSFTKMSLSRRQSRPSYCLRPTRVVNTIKWTTVCRMRIITNARIDSHNHEANPFILLVSINQCRSYHSNWMLTGSRITEGPWTTQSVRRDAVRHRLLCLVEVSSTLLSGPALTTTATNRSCRVAHTWETGVAVDRRPSDVRRRRASDSRPAETRQLDIGRRCNRHQVQFRLG